MGTPSAPVRDPRDRQPRHRPARRGDHPARGGRARPPDRTAHRRRRPGGRQPRDRLHPELRHRTAPRGDRRAVAQGRRAHLFSRRDRDRPRRGAGDGSDVRGPARRRRRGVAAGSGVAQLRDDRPTARRGRRAVPPACFQWLPSRPRPAARPDHRAHPDDRGQQPGQPHRHGVPRRARGFDRRARRRPRPVGPVRRGVRRAGLRGNDGQCRAVRPRARRRPLQLLQDLLDDRLEGRLRRLSSAAGATPRHAPGAVDLVHLRGQPVRRPGSVGGAAGRDRPQAGDLPRTARPRRRPAPRRRVRSCSPGGRLLPDGPAGPGHRQPPGRNRPRRPRSRHRPGNGVRRRRQRPAAPVTRRIGDRPAHRDRATRRLGAVDGGRGVARRRRRAR